MDIELYDRLIRVYEINTIKKFMSSTVCIIGLDGGFSSEIIKNLILNGISNIYLYDNENINYFDVENNIYYNIKDIGKSRINVLLEKLIDFKINIYELKSFNDIIKCDVVITINKKIKEMIKYNNITRLYNKKFIGLLSKNISGCIFVDAGLTHNINQINNEIHYPIQISKIDYLENKICVTCLSNHELINNDFIEFTNLEGTNIDILLNKHFQIIVLNKNCFEFEFKHNIKGEFINGTINYVKKSILIYHKPLSEYYGFSNEYLINNPLINSNIDHELLKYYIFDQNNIYYNTIQPIISIMGSLVSSEILKLISEKGMPINQWFTWSDKCLNYNKVLSIKNKLKESKWFIAGAGSIGCELLKNLAYLKVGSLIINDHDIIEKSNLSNQFLFKLTDIGKFKSQTATNAIKHLNNDIIITTLTEKIENNINPLFEFNKINGVFNALDNIEARKIIDNECLNYGLPLFESGIMGTKGSTQPIIPYVTETYNDLLDIDIEKTFPICVIKNFPNEILHIIKWATEQYEIFNRFSLNINKWLKNTIFNNNNIDDIQAIQDIYNIVYKYKIKKWQDCVILILDMFYDNYNNQILQLLHNFPINTVTSEGTKFWSSGKRCPKPIIFDINNKLHINYIKLTILLFCESINIDCCINVNELLNIINKYKIKEFIPDTENKKINIDVLPNIDKYKLIYKFKNNKILNNNNYIKWINYASNLRANNYNIPMVDIHYTKGIVNKIIPSLSITASLVAGLITIEMLKYMCDNDNKIDKYKSSFINLDDVTLISAEPIKSRILNINNKQYNSWYKFIEKDCLLLDFKDKYEKMFNTSINMITINSSIIFADFITNENNLLSEIIKKYDKDINLDIQTILITIISSDSDIELPNITFNIIK